jgi:hypothetical protein
MDVLEAVASRYSCRAFLRTPVPEKIARDIINRAARAHRRGQHAALAHLCHGGNARRRAQGVAGHREW